MAHVAERGRWRADTGLRLYMASRVTRVDWLILYPLVCPAVLLWAGNDAFGFDPPGWLDSFIYLGYFWHYPEHLWLFDDNSNYKISRLPWVLPGFAAHALLPPVTAALILAYGTLTSAALALYLHVRDAIRDRYAAAFAGVLLACCTSMHAPGGWYYHTLAAAGYYLWACWLVTRAASGRYTAAWAAAAGASFAAAVHTHVFLVVFAPLLAILYWGAIDVSGEHRPPSRWGTAAVSAIAGGIALTAVLGVVNRLTGGEWLFFVPQLKIALELSQHDRWWLPAEQWLPGATYLVLPIAMIAMGLSSGNRPWNRQQRLKGTLVALPCVALALTCIFQFWTRETTLDYDYMAFVLYLHAFGAAATALCEPAAEGGWRRPVLLALATTVVLGTLLAFMPSDLPALMTRMATRIGLETPRILPPLLLGLAGVAIVRAAPRPVRMPAAAVWLAVVNAWVAPQPAAYGFRTPGTRQEMLETFHDADEFAHRLDPTMIGIKYWLSSETLTTAGGPLPSQPIFDSFLATRAWLTNLFARTSPGAPMETLTLKHLEAATCVGILSSPGQQAPLARTMIGHYAALDRPLRIVAERRFERPGFAFALTVLKPVDAAGDGTAGARPCSSNSSQ